MMMQSITQEVAPPRIRVNSIAPGAIRTPINESAWDTLATCQQFLGFDCPQTHQRTRGRRARPSGSHPIYGDYVSSIFLYVDGGMTLYPGFTENG